MPFRQNFDDLRTFVTKICCCDFRTFSAMSAFGLATGRSIEEQRDQFARRGYEEPHARAF